MILFPTPDQYLDDDSLYLSISSLISRVTYFHCHVMKHAIADNNQLRSRSLIIYAFLSEHTIANMSSRTLSTIFSSWTKMIGNVRDNLNRYSCSILLTYFTNTNLNWVWATKYVKIVLSINIFRLQIDLKIGKS